MVFPSKYAPIRGTRRLGNWIARRGTEEVPYLRENCVGFMAPFLFHMTYSCDEGFDIHPASGCTKALQGLRIDPRRLMSKLLDIFNIGAGINGGIAVRATLAPKFEHT